MEFFNMLYRTFGMIIERFNPMQRCLICGIVSAVLAYFCGNVIVWTGFCFSVVLGWFLANSILRLKEHVPSEGLLDLIDLIQTKYNDYRHNTYGTEQVTPHVREPSLDAPESEIRLFISHIMRDFFTSWYCYISDDQRCVEEFQDMLEDITCSCRQRIKQVQIHHAVEDVVRLFQKHLCDYQEAKRQWALQPNYRKKGSKNGPEFKKKKTIVQMFRSDEKFHVCLQSSGTEYRYTLVIMETLLKILLEERLYECYAVKELIKEILAVNVIQTLVDLISDPNFIHKALVLILSDEELIMVDKPIANHNVEESTVNDEPDLSMADTQTFTADQSILSIDTSDNVTSTYHTPEEPQLPIMPLQREDPEGEPSGNKVAANIPSNEIQGQIDQKISDAQLLHNHAENPNYTVRSNTDPLLEIPTITKTSSAPNLTDLTDNEMPPTSQADPQMSPAPRERKRRPSLPDQLTELPNLHLGLVPRTFSNESFESEGVMQIRPQFFISADDDGDSLSLFSETGDEVSVGRSGSPRRNNSEDMTKGSTSSERSLRILPHKVLHRTSSEGSSSSLGDSAASSTTRGDIINDEVDLANEAFADLEGSTHVPPVFLFADVHILNAESAREPYSGNTYTLYNIKYMAWHHSKESESWVLRRNSVKRRYREFITLQERLEDHPVYKGTMRYIKGPNRWRTLHFGQLKEKKVEARRVFLQSYLKTIIQREDIGNSMAIKEFLAYDGDAHIAFVKKAPEIPRLDKVIVKTVSGVFSRLSSALPIIPDDTVQGPSVRRGHATRRRASDPWADPDRISFTFATETTEDASEIGIEDVLTRCVHAAELDGGASTSSSCQDQDEEFRDAIETSFLISGVLPRSQGDGCDNSPPQVKASDSVIPLTAAILDLGIQISGDADLWVGREKAMYAIKVLVGKALENFLQTEITQLTMETKITLYMELLRETLWPSGKWNTEQVPPPSEEQRNITKHQARSCLANFLPRLIPWLIGTEEYDRCIDEVMDCLQYPELNRHFAYCFLDLILDTVFPEFQSGRLHEELLTTHQQGQPYNQLYQ